MKPSKEERVPLLTVAGRRARSYTDAELREVVAVSNGHAPSRASASCCRVNVLDYDGERLVQYGSMHSYCEAPDLTTTLKRLISVIQPASGELKAIADKLKLPELRTYGDGCRLGESMLPRVEVYDEERMLIAVDAPLYQPSLYEGSSQASSAHPTSLSGWYASPRTEYVPVVMMADTRRDVLVIVHTGDARGGEALEARLLGVLRHNVDDVRKHSVVHLISVATTYLVDRFYPVLEAESELLDSVEAALLSDDTLALHKDIVRLIARTKRSMLGVRRRLWPFRRCLARLTLAPLRTGGEGRFYTRALLDHVVHLLDVLELQRDAAHALLEVFLSAHNNRMQEVMTKVAVVTTIFVPLTFLTGLEGMNFKFMPELSGRYSYPVFLCLVVSIVFGMVSWFRRRGWL